MMIRMAKHLLLLAGLVFLAACAGMADVDEGGTAVPAAAPAAGKPQLIEFYADW